MPTAVVVSAITGSCSCPTSWRYTWHSSSSSCPTFPCASFARFWAGTQFNCPGIMAARAISGE